MTIYEKVTSMSKKDFTRFMELFYYKASKDGANFEDNGPWIRQRMANADESEIEELFKDL